MVRTPMNDSDFRQYLKDVEDKYGLPCADPMRIGVAGIVDQLIGSD